MTRQESGSYLSVILELSKVKITVAVAFTTITGYILAARGYDPGFLLPTLGIFFLACGSSVINHLQERRTDAMMARTRKRPLPSHKISFSSALHVAVTETLAGSLILYFSSGVTALILGLLAMVWYNLIYTNLKRITPHAVIPGSVIGSIPPLVGWVSAGGHLFSLPASHPGRILFCMAGTAFLPSGHKVRSTNIPKPDCHPLLNDGPTARQKKIFFFGSYSHPLLQSSSHSAVFRYQSSVLH